MSLQSHSLEYHQILQLMFKLREKGLIDTEDIRQIIDNALTEMKAEREVVE